GRGGGLNGVWWSKSTERYSPLTDQPYPSAYSMPPPTVQPLRVLLSWWPVAIGLVVSHSEASIFAQAPPPVTYTSVLSPNHQKLVKPSRPRAVTNQRSWVSEIQFTNGRGGLNSNAWPDLLVAEPSPSMPNTHAPHCQLQPSWPPPMKPDRSKLSVRGDPATDGLTAVLPAVVKCWLDPFEVPALAPA